MPMKRETANRYQQEVLRRVERMDESPPPPPWRPTLVYVRSGLLEIGFKDSSDLLLLVCHDRREVVNCQDGAIVTTETHDALGEWYDQANLMCSGIGPLCGDRIRIAGASGGGLALLTRDGWSIAPIYAQWWIPSVILRPPGESFFSEAKARNCVRIEIPASDDFRTCGFSPTGRSLVAADAGELRVFFRESL